MIIECTQRFRAASVGMLMTLAASAVGADHPGQQPYRMFCMSCHGAELEGATGANLMDAEWKHGSAPADIERAIRQGFAQAGMPAWEGLIPEDQIAAITDYVMSQQIGLREMTVQVQPGYWEVSSQGPVLPGNPAWQAEQTISVTKQVIDFSPEIIGIEGGKKGEHFAALYTGRLYLPETGRYQFDLVGDGQSWLAVNGQQVVDHRERRDGNTRVSGEIQLSAGAHDIAVGYQTDARLPRLNDRGRGGILVTVSGGELSAMPLHTAVAEQRVQVSVPRPLQPTTMPLISRHHVANMPASAISIGFPAGGNLTLDGATATIVQYWPGPFIDLSPHAFKRGQKPVITGYSNNLPTEHIGVWADADAKPVPWQYRGIQTTADGCVLTYELDGERYELAVVADAEGYAYALTGPPLDQQIFIEVARPEGLSVTGALLTDSQLQIPADEPVAVQVTVSRDQLLESPDSTGSDQ